MERRTLQRMVSCAIGGDPKAQEDLCRIFAKSIWLNVRARLANQNDVDDVAQEVAIQMLQSIHTLKSPYAFSSWLRRIIANTCSSSNEKTFKKESRESDIDEESENIPDVGLRTPESVAEGAEEGDALIACVSRLPNAQRISILMYYYDDMSYKEISDALGVTVGAVSYNISKAKENLRTMLSGDKVFEEELARRFAKRDIETKKQPEPEPMPESMPESMPAMVAFFQPRQSKLSEKQPIPVG